MRALLGPKAKVLVNRGKLFESEWGPNILVTVHPSSILRAPDDETRRVEMAQFVDALRKVAAAMAATV